MVAMSPLHSATAAVMAAVGSLYSPRCPASRSRCVTRAPATAMCAATAADSGNSGPFLGSRTDGTSGGGGGAGGAGGAEVGAATGRLHPAAAPLAGDAGPPPPLLPARGYG